MHSLLPSVLNLEILFFSGYSSGHVLELCPILPQLVQRLQPFLLNLSALPGFKIGHDLILCPGLLQWEHLRRLSLADILEFPGLLTGQVLILWPFTPQWEHLLAESLSSLIVALAGLVSLQVLELCPPSLHNEQTRNSFLLCRAVLL